MGSFLNGRLSEDHKSIIINKEQHSFVVNSGYKSRPGKSKLIHSVLYQYKCARSAGWFRDGLLVAPFELKFSESTDDIMDMGKDLMNPNLGPRYVKYSDEGHGHVFES